MKREVLSIELTRQCVIVLGIIIALHCTHHIDNVDQSHDEMSLKLIE